MDIQKQVNNDMLKQIRRLPKDLIKELPTLMVNRQGITKESGMYTQNFIGYIEPECTYKLTVDGFTPTQNPPTESLPKPTKPPLIKLTGDWISNNNTDEVTDSNILGGNGQYILPESQSDLTIPVAETTASNLAYYGCRLTAIGDTVQFKSTCNLPVSIMSIGKDYVDNYLMQPELGGGAYFEIHDRPHFHMPLSPESGGYLIIGKSLNDKTRVVSGFKIPYGFSILMAPWVIHSDAHLIGQYMVIYSATPEFSTVILTTQDGQLANIQFEEYDNG